MNSTSQTGDDFDIYSQDLFGDESLRQIEEANISALLNTSYRAPFNGIGSAGLTIQPSQFRVVSSSLSSLTATIGQESLQGQEPPINESDLELSPSFLNQFTDSDTSVKLELIDPAQLTLATTGRAGISHKDDEAVKDGIDNFVTISHIQTLIPDEETVTLDNWAGPFNFKVTPLLVVDKGGKKNAVYSGEHQKLFCKTATAVPFKFELDYDKIDNLRQFMVRTYLVYEDNDVINKAVLRCISCIEQEKGLTEKDKTERLSHMLRPHNPNSDIKYYRSPTSKRCYLLTGLKTPEPGMTYSTNTYCFSCRNSCTVSGIDGKSRRAIAIMFYLFDLQSGTVVGRSHTRVRICSAPVRDYNKEINCASGTTNRKRKSTDIEQDVLPAPKQVNLGSGVVEMASSHRDIPRVLLLHQRQPMENSVRSIVRASGRSDEDVSSSQETVYSCDESENRIQLRDLVKDIRWVLKLKHSENPALRSYSQHMFNSLRMAQDLCDSARCREEEIRRAREQERSPDGGFHDNGVD